MYVVWDKYIKMSLSVVVNLLSGKSQDNWCQHVIDTGQESQGALSRSPEKHVWHVHLHTIL